MQIPLDITFRHMDRSPAMEARVQQLVERLEKFCEQIVRCRVVIEAPHHHRAQGRLFKASIHLSVPGREITVGEDGVTDHSHEDPHVALRDAFKAARRQLQDYARLRRGDVKKHGDVKIKRQYG